MIGNLFSLLLVLGLVVLFGWLAYRALRARKVWVKIVGGLVAGLLALVFLGVAIMGGRERPLSILPVRHRPRS